jgi:rhodanese-related sulfurtransferase
MNENFDVSAADLYTLLNGTEAINLIDVRNEDEYDEDNIGGTLIPLGDLTNNIDQLEPLKGQDIYIHCRSGARSDRAKQILIANGFSKVHNVLGGILAFREL